jgi:hypothetical protein
LGEIGLFWTEHTGMQYSRAFRYLTRDYSLDVADSARMLAMLWAGFKPMPISVAGMPSTPIASGAR